MFYVINYDTSKDIIVRFFIREVSNASKKLKRRIDCDYQFNQVCNRDGKSLGHGYLWLSNSEVFNMAMGLNPDGSERVRIKIQGDSQQLAKELEEQLDVFIATPMGPNDSWADVQEQEDAIRAKYAIKEVKEPLVPLIKLDKLKKEHQTLVITPFEPKHLDDRFYPHMLYCPRVPKWVNESMLLKEFQPYSKRKIGINIGNGSCSITFPRNSADAQMALAMKAKVVMSCPRTNSTSLLLFRHAYAT